jgi:PAS domain S-box-containing protein
MRTIEKAATIEEKELLLQQERRFLDKLLSTSPDRIYFKDLASRFIKVNDAVVRWLGGKTTADLLGRTDADFFGEEHAHNAGSDERYVMSTGNSIIAKEEKETWPDGHCTWASSTKVPLRDDDGKIIGIVGISRDITDHKLIEAEREKLLGELQEAFARIKILRGLLPICAACKKIRDDKGYWSEVEQYIEKRVDVNFSHSICPECAERLYPEICGPDAMPRPALTYVQNLE